MARDPALLAPDVNAASARSAVAASSRRLTEILRAVRQPSAPALGDWDLTDVAVHVSHALDAITAMARGGGSVIDDIWNLSDLTGALVTGESERDLAVVAERIEATVGVLLAELEAAGAGESRPWLIDGVELPVESLACHALNELEVHGRDIAVAAGMEWRIPRAHAGLVLNGFLFPVASRLGRALVNHDAAGRSRVCMEIRIRGGGRAFWCFDDGDLTLTREPPGRVDCHLSVDPEAFLLVAWGRMGQWPAIARGQLLAWGRRPWLGLKLRALVRNP